MMYPKKERERQRILADKWHMLNTKIKQTRAILHTRQVAASIRYQRTSLSKAKRWPAISRVLKLKDKDESHESNECC